MEQAHLSLSCRTSSVQFTFCPASFDYLERGRKRADEGGDPFGEGYPVQFALVPRMMERESREGRK